MSEDITVCMPNKMYMVVEHFKDAQAVYRRFRERGRLAPEGLTYVSSWVDVKFERCFQLMESDEAALLQRWILQWRDLVDFEVVPVSPSKVVRELFAATGEPANRTASGD